MSGYMARWRGPCVFLVWLMGSWMPGTSVHAAGSGGGQFGGTRIGGVGGYSGYSGGSGGLRPGSSVIRHGNTGFSIYSQHGVTRVIGEPPVSKRILLPDGRSTRMIGDGSGGAYIFGSSGNHRIPGNRPLFGNDGP